VKRDEAREWQVSEEELFTIAISNLKQKSNASIERLEIEPGLEILLISDESFLVSGHALCFQDHPEWIGAHGALVGFPKRDAIVTYPINSIDCAKAVAPM